MQIDQCYWLREPEEREGWEEEKWQGQRSLGTYRCHGDRRPRPSEEESRLRAPLEGIRPTSSHLSRNPPCENICSLTGPRLLSTNSAKVWDGEMNETQSLPVGRCTQSFTLKIQTGSSPSSHRDPSTHFHTCPLSGSLWPGHPTPFKNRPYIHLPPHTSTHKFRGNLKQEINSS